MKNNILTSTLVITLLLGLTHPAHAFGRKKAKAKPGPAAVSGSIPKLSDAIAGKPKSDTPAQAKPKAGASNSGNGNTQGNPPAVPGTLFLLPLSSNPLDVPGINPRGNPLASFNLGGGAGGTTSGGGGIGGGGIGTLLGGNAAGGLPGGFFGASPSGGGSTPGASGDQGGGSGAGGGLVNPPVVTRVSP